MEDVTPLGIGIEGQKRAIGEWVLTYSKKSDVWRGTSGNVDAVVQSDTDINDLKKLLDGFDRVSKNTSAMDQPRRVVMEIGMHDINPRPALASTATGKIAWWTRDGIIIAAGTDNNGRISNLDRMICHEITHLMEPELKDPLEQITKVLIEGRSIVGDTSSVILPPEKRAEIMAINPEYFDFLLDKWEERMSTLEKNHIKDEITAEDYKKGVHTSTESLAAEIISETACSRFWGAPKTPHHKSKWPEFEKAVFFTMAEMDMSMKLPNKKRMELYEQREAPSLPRGDYVLPVDKKWGSISPAEGKR